MAEPFTRPSRSIIKRCITRLLPSCSSIRQSIIKLHSAEPFVASARLMTAHGLDDATKRFRRLQHAPSISAADMSAANFGLIDPTTRHAYRCCLDSAPSSLLPLRFPRCYLRLPVVGSISFVGASSLRFSTSRPGLLFILMHDCVRIELYLQYSVFAADVFGGHSLHSKLTHKHRDAAALVEAVQHARLSLQPEQTDRAMPRRSLRACLVGRSVCASSVAPCLPHRPRHAQYCLRLVRNSARASTIRPMLPTILGAPNTA